MLINGIEIGKECLYGSSFNIASHPADYGVFIIDAYVKDFLETLLVEKFIVIDKKVAEIYGVKNSSRILKIEATEENKTLKSSLLVIDELSKIDFNKKDNVVVIGGGIIQDICAIAAKMFRRGIKWIFVPTTLLAMCDSCIGGKAAVNHHSVKNQIALFTAPSKVIINTQFLDTLHKKDIDCGVGEMVKLFALSGDEDFNLLFDKSKMLDCIKSSLLIKKAIIEHDEFEQTIRQSLNYGHTFGHALESITNYKIPHGVAVMYGMYMVNLLFGDNEPLNKILVNIINVNKLSIILKGDKDKNLIQLLKQDKKNTSSKSMFIRVPRNGTCVFEQQELTEEFIGKIYRL